MELPVNQKQRASRQQESRPTYFDKEEKLLPVKQKVKYREFYDAARYNEILEPKTTLMLHLASAMAIGCYP